jgi:hypothetical protein
VQQTCSLLDHLVGNCQYARWYLKAERFGGRKIYHELYPRRLLDRQIAWLVAFEDAPCIDASEPVGLRDARTIAQEPAAYRELAVVENRWDAGACSQAHKLFAPAKEVSVRSYGDGLGAALQHAAEGRLDIAFSADVSEMQRKS